MRKEVANMPAASRSFYRVTWLLLLIAALLTVLFPLLDIAGTARTGLPSDHAAAYRTLAGHSFPGIQPTGPTRYIRQLEYGYALHELTFALLFLVLVAIPVRTGQRWAWLACWLILIATVGYTITFAHYSTKTFAYSLVPDIAIPVLLLMQAPRFWKQNAGVTPAGQPAHPEVHPS
jgi:hypothetical protein